MTNLLTHDQGLSDATASDCAGAIGQIDPSNAAAINPSGGTTKNEADGTWISTYNSGSCGVAVSASPEVTCSDVDHVRVLVRMLDESDQY